jgi:hypothetical protein
METMTKLKARVRNGSQFLRELDPDWFKKIDIDTIDLHDPKKCILGQVFGDYCTIANKLEDDRVLCHYYLDGSKYKSHVFDDDFCQCGFDLAYHHDKDDEVHLVELWTTTILRIKQQVTT